MPGLPPYEGADLPIPIEGINIVVVSIVFEALAIFAVILRFWSRWIKNLKLSLNDYSIIVALVFTSALVADLLIAVYMGGEGQHAQYLGLKQLAVWSRVFFTGQLLWAAGNCAVKISILHLYLTVFVGRTFRICCFVLMGFSVAYMLMTILVDFLICTPVNLNWDDFVTGHCGNQRKAYLYTGIINLLIDVCIVVLPMPLLWGLQMPTTRKMSLTVMFSLGAVICILTILRINSVQILDLGDVTFSCAPLALWTVLEPTLGIVNACLPAMQPSLQKLFGADSFRHIGLSLTSGRRLLQSWGRTTQSKQKSGGESNATRRQDEFHPLKDYSYAIGPRSVSSESKETPMVPAGPLNQENDGQAIKVINAWKVHTGTVRSQQDIV